MTRHFGEAERVAVVLAPHHADTDRRIRRTFDALVECGFTVHAYWDDAYPGHVRRTSSDGRIREVFTRPVKLGIMRSLLGGAGIPREVRSRIRTAELVYVHAGGIEGLVLAAESRRLAPEALIVFDYHDHLPYQLQYQLRKRGLQGLFNVLVGPFRGLARQLAQSLDGLVGISAGQVRHFQHFVDRCLPSGVVPNVRPFDLGLRHGNGGDPLRGSSFVWIGQVMLGRDLERVADLISHLGSDASLHIFGTVLDSRAEAAVTNRLGSRAVFHGSYSGDADLAGRLPPGAIGVFLGWDDPGDTGINAIASPNKFFTYVNLGVPVLIDSSLSGLDEALTGWNAGLSISSDRDFPAAAANIRSNYPDFTAGMLRMKQHYAGFDPRGRLEELIRSLTGEC